jgi:hypothetical protein
MKTFFLEEQDSFSRPGRFLFWYWKKISFLGLKGLFPGTGRFLCKEWKISFQGLDDSFPAGRFLSRERKISCCKEEFPLFNRSRGSFSFEAEVYSIIFKGPSCQISCKYFFILAVHFYLMKNPPKGSKAVLSTLSADPKPSFKHKCMICAFFLEKRQLAHYKLSSTE